MVWLLGSVRDRRLEVHELWTLTHRVAVGSVSLGKAYRVRSGTRRSSAQPMTFVGPIAARSGLPR